MVLLGTALLLLEEVSIGPLTFDLNLVQGDKFSLCNGLDHFGQREAPEVQVLTADRSTSKWFAKVSGKASADQELEVLVQYNLPIRLGWGQPCVALPDDLVLDKPLNDGAFQKPVDRLGVNVDGEDSQHERLRIVVHGVGLRGGLRSGLSSATSKAQSLLSFWSFESSSIGKLANGSVTCLELDQRGDQCIQIGQSISQLVHCRLKFLKELLH